MIIAEGVDDFLVAKKKVARRLGFSDRLLPANDEIERALLDHRKLFPSPEQERSLARLRKIAVEAMEFLEEFSPYLTGNIIDGNVGPHNDILIYLPVESPEEVMIKLMNNGIPFTETTHCLTRSAQRRKTDYPGIRFLVDGTTINVHFFQEQLLRETLNSGKSRVRSASLKNARRLTELPAAEDD